MINRMIRQVAEFHDAFGVKRGNVDVKLRYDLFKEEFEEYKDAKDLVGRADAIVDMLYIECGTLDVHEWECWKETVWKRQSEDSTLMHIDERLDNYLNNHNHFSVITIIDEVFTLAYINGIYDILPQLFDEVHASNMSKLDENGKPIINDGIIDPRKPIGKVLKGSNYFEPKLKEILDARTR